MTDTEERVYTGGDILLLPDAVGNCMECSVYEPLTACEGDDGETIYSCDECAGGRRVEETAHRRAIALALDVQGVRETFVTHDIVRNGELLAQPASI